MERRTAEGAAQSAKEGMGIKRRAIFNWRVSEHGVAEPSGLLNTLRAGRSRLCQLGKLATGINHMPSSMLPRYARTCSDL